MSYITVAGDTWDIIAYKVYQNEMYADKLMKANQEYLDMFVFDAGIELVVPEIEEEETENKDVLPPWRD